MFCIATTHLGLATEEGRANLDNITIDERKAASETSKGISSIEKLRAKAARAKKKKELSICQDRIIDASRGEKGVIPSIVPVHVTHSFTEGAVRWAFLGSTNLGFEFKRAFLLSELSPKSAPESDFSYE